MPDLPTPHDAAGAAEFDESWDTVLSYADLCAVGSEAAADLATEAFAHGVREVRTGVAGRGAGRRPATLPRLPLLLAAVRDTAADWEARGQGHRLDPQLRLWLTSGQAARPTGPPTQRPLALRALQDMQRPDAALLWLTEVEALPPRTVAARLGLDPAGFAEELTEVRGLFRDRCLRNHLDRPLDAECRGHARLLDAVTRTAVADTPEDLSRHVARCATCSEAAGCLRVHGGALPAALAGGILGWGGLAYLERRRRAAEVRLATGAVPAVRAADATPCRIRALRGGLVATAVVVSLVALGVSLMPFGDGKSDAADRVPATDPDVTEAVQDAPSAGSSRSPRAAEPPKPSAAGSEAPVPGHDAGPEPDAEPASEPEPEPEPQGTSATGNRHGEGTGSGSGTGTGGDRRPEAPCHATYEIVSEWTTGFEAVVKVTTERPLDNWTVGWTFPDGQSISSMWDTRIDQKGSRVTARAAHYNRTVPADGTLAFGFVGLRDHGNAPARDFTLNGRTCRTG
ncbi:cellulose binding domain-containing protein [Streptomyces sp. NPDC091377]|uniref:cellulose binding domain-containing protein n=1 Tax=Streptomyces sp. NPDC091377 TaxID=3365995 RepID=UPI0038262E24